MNRSVPEEGGEAVFLSQLGVIERVISFVCARHLLTAADSDDFGSHVKLKLIEDDYAVLRKFEGRSSLRTYLTVVIERLFLDYRISAWGKWRPSAEARRAGAVGVLLERLLVREGYRFEQAYELMKINHRVSVPRSTLERLAARLPARSPRRFESDDILAEFPSALPPVDDVLVERERQSVADHVAGALQAVMSQLEAQDRLILALRFEDGLTVAQIAVMLRLDQKALYRRVERLLGELRQALERKGVDGRSAMEMLESPAVSFEWQGDPYGEISTPSPSIVKGAPE